MPEINMILIVGLSVIALLLLVLLWRLNELQNKRLAQEDLADERHDALIETLSREKMELEKRLVDNGMLINQKHQAMMEFFVRSEGSRHAQMRELGERLQKQLQESAKEEAKSRLESQAKLSKDLMGIHEILNTKLLTIKETVEGSLEKVRAGNEVKLEAMRQTVEEKLDKTLNERLTTSFKIVDEKLGLVQNGLGEMRQMAASVSDLKGVLTNVKTRGMFGETQLENLLAQVLTPQQYEKQKRLNPEKDEVVDFAIRLPGKKEDAPVWLPVDAKFPVEDYRRVLDAQDAHDVAAEIKAIKQLEKAVITQAKSIQEKYVCPPHTTEFAVMFLPSEGLYAEVVRIPELLEKLQREYRITVAGPTVIAALINSLQMGFVTLAMQERSAQVWQILGSVKGEFNAFKDQFRKVNKKFDEAHRSLKDMQTRSNVMDRKMMSIETLPGVTQIESLESLQDETDTSTES